MLACLPGNECFSTYRWVTIDFEEFIKGDALFMVKVLQLCRPIIADGSVRFACILVWVRLTTELVSFYLALVLALARLAHSGPGIG